MVLVALAGPGTNLVLAIASALVFRRSKPSCGRHRATTATSFTSGSCCRSRRWRTASVVDQRRSRGLQHAAAAAARRRARAHRHPAVRAGALVAAIEPFGFVILAVLLMTHAIGPIVAAPIK
jgi:hypothetical protein